MSASISRSTMSSFSSLSILLVLLLVLLTSSPVSVSSTSVIARHKSQCRKWKRVVWQLKESLRIVETECPKERRKWYRKATRTRRCVFAPWNGLTAARRIERICWKKWVPRRYRWKCRRLSWACKKALKYTKRGDKVMCEKRIRKLSWLLKKAMKKLKYYERFCNPKPSNMPRKPKW